MGYRGGGYMNVKDERHLKNIKNATTHCAYCRRQYEYLEIEHIEPLSKGGRHSLLNITLACHRCNRHKWDFDLSIFLERIWIKRDNVYDSFLSYSGRYRAAVRRGNLNEEYKKMLVEGMVKFRDEHNYFTAIINSILTDKYKIFHGEGPGNVVVLE